MTKKATSEHAVSQHCIYTSAWGGALFSLYPALLPLENPQNPTMLPNKETEIRL